MTQITTMTGSNVAPPDDITTTRDRDEPERPHGWDGMGQERVP